MIELNPAYDFSTKQGCIKAIIEECKRQGIKLNKQIAYVLATVEHETGGTYLPVYEAYYLGPKKALAYLKKLKYYPYFGRGYVQLTWLANYKKYSDILGIDLVKNPNLAMRPDIALFILVDGFKYGRFTGKTIFDYIDNVKNDTVNARRCINGVDKAKYIAKLAANHLKNLNI